MKKMRWQPCHNWNQCYTDHREPRKQFDTQVPRKNISKIIYYNYNKKGYYSSHYIKSKN